MAETDSLGTAKAAPLVTVYIPSRSRPRLLDRAVRSVLSQTWGAIELIVVLDGPCPDSEAVLTVLGKEDWGSKRFRHLVLPKARGACAARNAAIALASGHFITGLDDDDYFLPHHVAGLVSAFDPGRSSLLFTGYLRLSPLGASGVKEETVLPSLPRVSLPQLMRSNVIGNQVFTTLDRMRTVSGFDEALPAWQDYDCWVRLVQEFGPAAALPDCSYVQDQCSAPARISNQPARVDAAIARFAEKHAGSGGWAFASFLRMNKAFYGHDALTPVDLARILLADARWFIPALRHYLGRRIGRPGGR